MQLTQMCLYLPLLYAASVLEGSVMSGEHLVTERISDTLQLTGTIAAELGDD